MGKVKREKSRSAAEPYGIDKPTKAPAVGLPPADRNGNVSCELKLFHGGHISLGRDPLKGNWSSQIIVYETEVFSFLYPD